MLLSVLGFLLLIPATLVIASLASGETGILGAGVVVFLIQSPFVLLLLWTAKAPRLVLSETGIELHWVVGKRLFVNWEQIECLSPIPGHEGFVLRQPLASRSADRLAATVGIRINGASMYSLVEENMIADRKWIPLRAFAGWLRKGSLLADLERLAPRLASDYRMGQPGASQVRLKNWTVFTIVGLVVIIVTSLAAAAGLNKAPALISAIESMKPLAGLAETAFCLVLAACFAVIALNNLVAAAKRFKSGQFGWALLWISASLVQSAWAMFLLTGLFD